MKKRRLGGRLLCYGVVAVLVAGCMQSPVPQVSPDTPQASPDAKEQVETRGALKGKKDPLDSLGIRFAKLALALGVHDTDYVDAYSGPETWRDEARQEAKTLDTIAQESQKAAAEVNALSPQEGIDGLRQRFLAAQFAALAARARIVSGERVSFDEETKALYDAVAPVHTAAYFEKVLDELNQALPGTGSLTNRVAAFREDFLIDPERLDTVFKRAIDECRRLTLERIELPEHESFTVEYVTDKPWSGYNWYQGDARSLIQVNTEFPIPVDRAVDLACHEGYPGHHVYNMLLEKNLLQQREWMEFSVFPLFSPTALIAEGSANYGIDMVFDFDQRMAFEESVIFPLAGLDASRAREYYAVQALLEKLKYAGNFVARRYIDEIITADEAADELVRFSLMVPEKARQRVRFIDKYRSYVINYNLGKDLVAAWVERDDVSEEVRWQRFEKLLSQPTLPSMLTQ